MAKVPYKKLLTEAISEFDTSKASEVKGPFLDPILSWDGGGELPTNKAIDAGSILERYYYKEKADDGVNVYEADYSGKDDTEATSYDQSDPNAVKGKSTDHTMGAGTEQAGTDSGHNTAKKREEEIAKEDEDLSEDLENSIIEKIISEMEEEDDDEGDEEDMKEAEDKFEGVKKALEMPDEKEMKDPEEHSMGAGTPQAGTGDKEGEVPDRKDMHDKMVKPHNYAEALLFEEGDEEMEDDKDMDEEMKEALSLLEADDEDMEDEGEEEMEESSSLSEQDEEEGDDKEEEDLDVDEKMEEGMPLKVIAQGAEDKDYGGVEEAFQIFKEQMEDDEDEDEEEDED